MYMRLRVFPYGGGAALLRRSYCTVGVEKVKMQPTSSTIGNAVDRSKIVGGGGGEVGKRVVPVEKETAFWMKDPKTGNWIPETHFNQVDIVDLRNKFLTNKA